MWSILYFLRENRKYLVWYSKDWELFNPKNQWNTEYLKLKYSAFTPENVLLTKSLPVCLSLDSQRIQLKSYLSQQKILQDSMAIFDQDFNCRSLLRFAVNF